MSERMTEEPRYIPFEELDEETRREVIKTRRVIMHDCGGLDPLLQQMKGVRGHVRGARENNRRR